jgi:hypothetical protein
MQPKLKDDPREWQKFTLVIATVLCALGYGLYRRHAILKGTLAIEVVIVGIFLLGCAVKPHWFRGFYRAGMTVSFHVGQLMGKVMLTIFFLVVLTPLGWFLRLLGKDLLRLKRDPSAATYWQPAKPNQQFDRLF